MKPNTVILGWPEGWNKPGNESACKIFLHTIRTIASAKMALLVPKGIKSFPDSNTKVLCTYDICIRDIRPARNDFRGWAVEHEFNVCILKTGRGSYRYLVDRTRRRYFDADSIPTKTTPYVEEL